MQPTHRARVSNSGLSFDVNNATKFRQDQAQKQPLISVIKNIEIESFETEDLCCLAFALALTKNDSRVVLRNISKQRGVGDAKFRGSFVASVPP